MARWRGIFGRKGKREGEPDATPTASAGAEDDPVTALYPTTEPPDSDPFNTEDWEQVAPAETDTGTFETSNETGLDAPATEGSEERAGIRPFDPDTGTAEWAPPSPVAPRRSPEPEHTHDDLPDGGTGGGEGEERGDDTAADADAAAGIEAAGGVSEPPAGQRIQAAADEAAQVAEIRSHDEILALERDLEQAKANARSEIDDLSSRLREAEARAGQAEERAERLAKERDEVEVEAREAATQWLRQQVVKLRAEAQQRVREEVARIRAEGTASAEPGAPDAPPSALAAAEAEGLRSELKHANEEADARAAESREAGRREGIESVGDGDIESRLEAARAEGRAELEVELERTSEPRRRELEQRALEAAESKTAERIARIEADAEERIRSEVAVARRAAEERFAELLGKRERELQSEREDKATAIEQSHERLDEIEGQAVEAAERVSAAEQNLEVEKLRLQEESAAQLEIAVTQAQAVADQNVAERMRDREEELTDAIAAAVRSEQEVQAKVAEAEERARKSEERARAVEVEAAATISEVRQAAADWLREQTKSVRAEAERAARSSDSD